MKRFKRMISSEAAPLRSVSARRIAMLVTLASFSTCLIVSANPSSAATTPSAIYVSNCTASSLDVKSAASGGGSVVTSVAWTATSDTLSVTNECTNNVQVRLYAGASELLMLRQTVFGTSNTGNGSAGVNTLGPLGSTVTSIKIFLDSTGTTLGATISASAPGGSSGGGATTSPAAPPPQPVEATLSLDLAASGASCTKGSAVAGVMGEWLTLPAAGDCTSTTRPTAKLLGWSTSAKFPVALAQSQIDKGWGAIDDVFDGIRMIFIPAGKATFVSGGNSLHPIWAS